MESVFIAVAILIVGTMLVRATEAPSEPAESDTSSSSPGADIGSLFGLPSLTKPHVKEISLVLVRLQAYDDLVSGLDLEKLFALEDAFYSEVIRAAEGWQGEVDRFDGESVLLAFGRILKVEDHRANARDAAQALLRSLPAALGSVTHHDRTPEVTVVVTAGSVIVGPVGVDYRKVFTVFGPIVNEVYRWSSNSVPGTILVGVNRGFDDVDEWGDVEKRGEFVVVTPRHRADS